MISEITTDEILEAITRLHGPSVTELARRLKRDEEAAGLILRYCPPNADPASFFAGVCAGMAIAEAHLLGKATRGGRQPS